MERQSAGNRIHSAFLLPHPPVILPDIGRGRERDAEQTVRACQRAAAQASAATPDTVVIISPHAPLFSDFLFLYDSPRLSGSFARFGAPSVVLSAEQDTGFRESLINHLKAAAVPAGSIESGRLERMGWGTELDHGILVPLYFLQQAGTATNIVGLSCSAMDVPALRRAGRCIGEAARETGRSVCVIASGDLSHKVTSESPYGDVPEGAEFDRKICTAIDASDMDALCRIDPVLRISAAECGYASIIMMSALFDSPRCTRFSYEAPFGIGYCVAAFEQ